MGDKDRIEVKIAQIAARQQRNLTRRQLLALGMAATSITRWLNHGRLYRTGFPGVYSVGCPPITPRERAMAAVLACGPGAVLSHGSALTLWGIWKRWDMPFHVTVRSHRRPRGLKLHRNKLHRQEVTRHLGIPVTTLARTLLDQAKGMPTKSLNRAINSGREAGSLNVSQLVDVAQRNPRHPGKAALEYCIGIAPERPSRSEFEDDFPGFCSLHGLPQPEMNVAVCGYLVDALFANEKVIVELDGWLFHSNRFSFEDDRERDATTTAAGFVTVRLTKKRVRTQPEREADRLQQILALRRAA